MVSQLKIRFNKCLGEVQLNVDLILPGSGICAIFGRSGAGKTSLINAISGLVEPDEGEIEINGHLVYSSNKSINLPVEQRKIGYVFQEARLFPHYSVKGNLNYGVKVSDAGYFAVITKLLALDNLLERYPHDLSGGEKQRVAIGRALLSKPDVLLMDEPLASLDLPRKREVMPFLEELAQKVKLPILYVTHSMNEILRLADHLVVIEQGKVVTSGDIEQVWSSSHMRPWQSFSEQSSLFSAHICLQNQHYALTQVELADMVKLWVQHVEGEIGSSVRLQIRANDVSVTLDKPSRSSIRNILSAKVSQIEKQQQGASKKSIAIQLELAEQCYLWATITEWALDELQLEIGTDVFVQIKGVSVSQRDIVFTH
ncbi:molybdenum ABC transporter ATP-binding protein ModC [Vibrio aestuarianus]|uniref:molybdenum ABC transporter ATP-binding protein ModC n=1 Tax=Vibrio aestuarianus TaxID=28171 RepID=UPI003742A1ED